MSLQQLTSSQASPEAPINENFEALAAHAVYAMKAPTTSGLTWGYYGGRWGGNSVADSTLTLTGSNTNYVVVLKSTGVISTSTATTNWNDATNYARVYKITTSASAVTAVEDHRAGPGGTTYGETVGSGSTIGKHAIYVAAAGAVPSATGGCAALATIASASNQPDITTLNFDASSAEYAQFSIVMPKSWNESTLTFKAHWSHAATTTNFGVAWALQAVAMSDGDAIAAAFGTAITVTDTGGTTDDIYATAESSAMTVGGTPAAEDMVFFRVYRDPSNGSDDMAIDARLHGITVYMTTDAETDA